MSELPPAGWYNDPSGAPVERWWDGSEWTEHTKNPQRVAVDEAPAKSTPAGWEGWRTLVAWHLVVGGLAVIGWIVLNQLQGADF